MVDNQVKPLRELISEPFELMREMERRCRLNLAAVTGVDGESNEWVGIGCLLGDERFLVARAQVREVMMMPPVVTPVPGSKDWVAGLANLRGQLLPIIDLRRFLGSGSSYGVRTARVLVAENSELLIGIIVDEVYGFRRFNENEFSADVPETELRCERYLDGACVRGSDVWAVFSIDKLLDAKEFHQAAA
ncbi:MAG: purine-binding chemotaxis protein CheW [Gammaproteobacteria bacterium]|nr:purine-binding chemotaxis protein CheW [Gammaproteobacteria bacterium]MCP4091580.1 purine-binding chemotaxis protein CheW [Gammaproteobacteria bacterium]MCP4276076.1 purine-binding chemotaxis protein CheW [Gammaproteobacteria bacterium]MCP4832568.1 purine-binding chemotaxis protein CheW [Gammaproteobacteria bacterium]MCP4929646.1 purine-binding chemotaxis protein CheW [Gammaproteobacteria bacterium]